MKAMILAAGKGTRIRPLTYEMPKPMIPILGRPVMEYLVRHLVRCGVRDLMVNVSYLHEQIEAYFGDGQRFGSEIGYSFEGYRTLDGALHPQPLGSAGGMKKIQEFAGFFSETTLVICGDALIDLDMTAVLAQHRSSGAVASLVTKAVPREKTSEYGIVVADDDGRILSFQEKPSPNAALSTQASTGIYLFEPEVLELVPRNQVFDIASQLFPLLLEKGLPFYAQRHDFQWLDIGNVKDYWDVSQKVLAGEIEGMSMPGRQIAPGVWSGLNVSVDLSSSVLIGPIYIGAGSRIEPGSSIIGPTWIGHGSQIGSGAKVTASILFPYTRITSNTQLTGMVVCRDYCINRHGQTLQADETPVTRWSDARDRRIKPRGRAPADRTYPGRLLSP